MKQKYVLILIFFLLCCSYASYSFGQSSRGRGGNDYPPSKNKGRTGTYQCETKKDKYKYWVYVPSSYSETNPAGISIFFHGQGSSEGAKNFPASNYLEKYNLIGINMEYTDGNNLSDPGGKLKSAKQAVLQTMADYKIIHGRGSIASFSGGGIIHLQYFNQHGKGNPKRMDIEWTFCHSSLFGSNFWGSASGGVPMSWFVGLHQNERNMGSPSLGSTQIPRASELFGELLRGNLYDVVFLYSANEGHDISARDREMAMKQFRRSDLMLAPFIYLPDYDEPQLIGIVTAMNNLEYGKAEGAIKVLSTNTQIFESTKERLNDLQTRLTKRIDDVLNLAKDMAENDPIVCEAYSKLLLKQFSGHSKLNDLKTIIDPAVKKFSAGGLKKLRDDFVREAPDMIDMGNGYVPSKKKAMLERTIKLAGPSSHCGIMAKALLEAIEPAQK